MTRLVVLIHGPAHDPLFPVQSKFKPVKFACKQRSSLLSMLYQAMAFAAMHGQCPVATKILGCVDRPAYAPFACMWTHQQAESML